MTNKKDRKYGKVLGIRLTSTDKESLLAELGQKIAKREKFYVVTPNPEIVLLAQKDAKLKEIINEAAFSLPDGMGLKLFGDNLLTILHGRKIFDDLIFLSAKNDWRVFLFGGEKGVAGKVSRVLKSEYKKLKIEYFSGPKIAKDGTPASEADKAIEKVTIQKINSFKPHLLFVGLGAPKQEKWLAKNLPRLNVNCAMAVGGTFDYLAGVVPKTPVAIEKLEFEWLWRLITQPFRLGRVARVFKAVIVFPLKALGAKLK